MNTLLRVSLGAISGLVASAAFAPLGWSWLILLGVTGVIAACWRATLLVAALVGGVSGAVFFGLLLSWMTIIGPDAWLGLVLVCAAWWVLAAIGTAIVSRLPFAPLWVACVWIAAETLRDRVPFGGFPWGRFGFATVGTGMEYAASLGGVPILTAIVACIAACIVWVLAEPSKTTGVTLATTLIVAALMCFIGYQTLPSTSQTSSTISVVQGSVPEYGMGAMDTRRRVLDNHIAQTLKLAKSEAQNASRSAMVIWPENASDIDPLSDADAAQAITSTATAVDAPILVGAVITNPADARYRLNVGIVWTWQGPTQLYAKTHPVPFGEYIPFRSQLANLTDRFDRIPSDFAAGERPGNLNIAGVNVGDVICFEIAYDAVVRDVVTSGAQFIAVQTNNATYGATAQPEQQLAITRLRAIEHARWIAVAATSGVTAFIDPHGTVVQQLTDNVPGFLTQDVGLHSQLTIADRIGPAVEWAISVLAMFAVVVGLVFRRKERNVGLARE